MGRVKMGWVGAGTHRMRDQGPRWSVWGKTALAGRGPQAAPKQHSAPKKGRGTRWLVGVFVDGSSSARCPQSRGRDKARSHGLGAERRESRAAAARAPPAPGTGSTAVLEKQAGEGGGSELPNLPRKERLFRRKIADTITIITMITIP